MELVLGNIVQTEADAIVTPAHSDLRPSPGIRQAIFQAADTERLEEICRKIGSCPIGQAVVTPSCGLPCRYLIHVVGPDWFSGRKVEEGQVAACYLKALYKARGYHCRRVALPLMFSGEYHIPRAQALKLVFHVVEHFEQAHPEMEIKLVLYKESIYLMAQNLYKKHLKG